MVQVSLVSFTIDADAARARWTSDKAVRLRLVFRVRDAYEYRTRQRWVYKEDASLVEVFKPGETRQFNAYSGWIKEGEPYEAYIIDTGSLQKVWSDSGTITLGVVVTPPAVPVVAPPPAEVFDYVSTTALGGIRVKSRTTGVTQTWAPAYAKTQAYAGALFGYPPVVPPAIPEETLDFWTARGYSAYQAMQIVAWVKANKMTPTPATLKYLVGEPAGAAPPVVPEVPPVVPITKPWAQLTEAEKLAETRRLLAQASTAEKQGILGAIQSTFAVPALRANEYYTVATAEEKWEGIVQTAEIVTMAVSIAAGIGLVKGAIEALTAKTVGATAAKEAATIVTTQAVKEAAKTAVSATWREAIIASIKKNPLLTIFVATEIPNLIMMTQFARHQIAEETGTDITGIEFRLNDYEKALQTGGIEYARLIKAGDNEGAKNVLTAMEGTLTAYKAAIDANATALKKINGYENTIAIYSLYKETIAASWGQLPYAVGEVPAEFAGKVTGITDGDTIDVTDADGTVWRIRIVGIDAPEFKTTAGKAAAKFLTDLIWDKQVTVKVDTARPKDEYGRVLGYVLIGTKDVGLELLKSGNAQFYPYAPSKYVDGALYKASQVRIGTLALTSSPTYAKIFVDGVYTGHVTAETMKLLQGTYLIRIEKTGYEPMEKFIEVLPDAKVEERFELVKTTVAAAPAAPGEAKVVPAGFTISIDSVPSNAKLYIDNIYTKHWTPSDAKELRDVMHLLAPGPHKISVSKAGMYAEVTVEIVAGANEPIVLTLA